MKASAKDLIKVIEIATRTAKAVIKLVEVVSKKK